MITVRIWNCPGRGFRNSVEKDGEKRETNNYFNSKKLAFFNAMQYVQRGELYKIIEDGIDNGIRTRG